ncbi:hypothetical protein CYY_008273 [Polysphondylium violaceum]|uniref:Peptidase S28 family protein n=1 Tax=Polysphondylium violaceum TaxID=133409 RepID=A0A8J4PNI3_9MYCE|nr:hypothetical protein CYY_008273 [Polysphondylium violaceum]
MMMMNKILCLLLVTIFVVVSAVDAGSSNRMRYKSPYPYYSSKEVRERKQAQQHLFKEFRQTPPPPPYQELYYMQTLDHFNFQTQGTFAQRYLLADQFWNRPAKGDSQCFGPVLFYTGNEGDITLFYENTQFMTNVLAQEMNALILFAEHRYYGTTLPFGNSSFLPENLGYMTSEQALADYAQLLHDVLEDLDASNCPVIAIGGSYGGMLSAWMRIKYPNVVDGALAASAPVLLFLGTGVDQEGFNKIATQDFAQTSADGSCATRIRNAFNEILDTAQQSGGLAKLTDTFSLCQPLTDVNDLVNWIEAGLTYMAMADYPYPANFLEPMPGYPVNVSCERLAATTDDVQGLLAVIGVYFNYTGATTCYDLNVTTTSSLGNDGWDYQACTEMIMPITSDGVNDMFPPQPFDLADLTTQCQQAWNTTPNPNWIPTYYNGANFVASNIIFSNGVLDPWRAGGVLEQMGDSIVPIIIEGGAHHLDLRMPQPEDPASVVEAREIETKLLTTWVKEASQRKMRKN